MNITRLLPSEFRQSAVYYRLYYTYASTGFMAIGPVVILLVLNSLVVIVACRGQSPPPSTSVVLVVSLFIVCNALGLVINMVEYLEKNSRLLSYMVDVSNSLVVLNSSANFVIYYFFDRPFRITFHSLFHTERMETPSLKSQHQRPRTRLQIRCARFSV